MIGDQLRLGWRLVPTSIHVCMLFLFAEAAGIPVPSTKRGEPPFSMDANLLHISYEGNALEDPWTEPDESMFTRSVSPEEVCCQGVLTLRCFT